MKTCTRCKVEKPLDQFGSHLRMSDGHRSACKECERKPPRSLKCEGCGAVFLTRMRGIAPRLCASCDQRLSWCHQCKKAKPREEFYKQERSRTGLAYVCRACVGERTRTDKGLRSRKAAGVLHRYGITLAEYEAHLTAAEGVCPCCGKTGRKKMCLDHDHQTGRIRGVICSACNSGIGLLGDSVQGLEAAIRYLKRSPA